jgi:hypothetical protein
MSENNWGIRAVFEHNSLFLPHKYTYFDEVTYATEKEALEAINGDRGEELSQASSIDCKTEDDLKDHYLTDLEPYQLEDKTFELTYVADRFTLHTTVNALTQEQAEANAKANLEDLYGIDLDSIRCSLQEVQVSA